jgi:hypothetical protein
MVEDVAVCRRGHIPLIFSFQEFKASEWKSYNSDCWYFQVLGAISKLVLLYKRGRLRI